jgi:hypothetical protein
MKSLFTSVDFWLGTNALCIFWNLSTGSYIIAGLNVAAVALLVHVRNTSES